MDDLSLFLMSLPVSPTFQINLEKKKLEVNLLQMISFISQPKTKHELYDRAFQSFGKASPGR